jgi:hypothetical protein
VVITQEAVVVHLVTQMEQAEQVVVAQVND